MLGGAVGFSGTDAMTKTMHDPSLYIEIDPHWDRPRFSVYIPSSEGSNGANEATDENDEIHHSTYSLLSIDGPRSGICTVLPM